MPVKKKAKKKAVAKKTVAKKAARPSKAKVKKAAPRAVAGAPKAKKGPAKRKAKAGDILSPSLHLPWREPLAGESFLGIVDDYLSHIGVITLTVQDSLKAGQRIHVRGHTTDVSHVVQSMQVEHKPVSTAKAGDGVGVKINSKCRAGDYVYVAG